MQVVESDRIAISGTVIDTTGAVIQNARISIRNEEDGTEIRTVSDSSGRFDAHELLAGRYTVRIEMPGFLPRVQSASVDREHSLTLTVPLEIGAVNMGGPIAKSKSPRKKH